MTLEFNADEVFELAEQIERNGTKFYLKAAKGFRDKATVGLLEGLAKAEVEHEKTFRALRAQLSAKEKASTIFDPDGEAQAYLQAMAGGHVFDVTADPSETLRGDETLAEVLRTAIGLEKDSIVFYLGMKESVSAKGGRDRVDRIIREEMTHVAQLSRMLADHR